MSWDLDPALSIVAGLDEVTRAELAPSCEQEEPSCGQPAVWVARFTFRGVLADVRPLHRLLCDGHVRVHALHQVTCGECPAMFELRAEPLDRKAKR